MTHRFIKVNKMEVSGEHYNPKQNNPLSVTSKFSEDIKNITEDPPGSKKQSAAAAETANKSGK